MVWVSLCRVYLAVSLALNDRSPTGRFAFVSSFLDHRHLVTGVTSCIDYEDDTSLSLSLFCAQSEKEKRNLRMDAISTSVIQGLNEGSSRYELNRFDFYSIERRSILCGEIYNSRRDKNSIDEKEESEESREDFNTNKNIYPYNVPRYPCNGIEN